MKITFFSNYLSPHQIPFSDAMHSLLGEAFTFVSCEPYSMERKNMGWDADAERPYELRAFESEEGYQKALKLARECDVMIWGSARLEFVMARVQSKKLYIRYSERLFKKGFLSSICSLDILRHIKFNLQTRSPEAYLFSASAFSLFDYKLSLGSFKKVYKWGYFPKAKYYDIDALMQQKAHKQNVIILWAGRMLELKHPEAAIHVAEKLKQQGIEFTINMIGNGAMEGSLRKTITEKQLEDNVHLLGAMPPENVRVYMEQSDIFIFTSDFNEGWGAVLNESMNSGCAVVCSDAIGSSRYMIQDGINGLLFSDGNFDELAEKIRMLLFDAPLRKKLGISAYNSIVNLWSADIAAKRFQQWCTALESGALPTFEEGPMSPAGLVVPKRGWWRR